MDSYRLLVQFHPDVDRRRIAQLLTGIKFYEFVHIMTNVILNCHNWTQSASCSRDMKCPLISPGANSRTVFVGGTQGVGEDTAQVVASCCSSWQS